MSARLSVLFIGHFSDEGAYINKFASAAGDIVQRQIVHDAIQLVSENNFRYLSMEPQRIWPGGAFYVKGREDNLGAYISYINLPFLKNLIYAFAIFIECIRVRPALVIQYNSYLFENLGILLSASILRTKSCLILQDIRVGSEFSLAAQLYDKAANYLVRFFDFVMPISKKIADTLKLNEKQFYVFKGGITEQGYELLHCNIPVENYCVFAGALEAHNGIDRLISLWVTSRIDVDLHVFGRGSLASLVSEGSKRNPHIKFHGFLPHSEVSAWQKKAKYNFCLRYSDGLDEEYFFPSKFFNACCCPGLLIVNNFKNIPDFIVDSRGLINEIEDIKQLLLLCDKDVGSEALSRRRAVLHEGSWTAAIKLILKQFSLTWD